MSRHHRVASGTRIFGTPGGGLEGAPDWAANAEVAEQGRRGELATGAILDEIASRKPGPTVIHDVMLHARANIDHILISGTHVWLIDAKVYAPGNLWTLGGQTRRGRSQFPYPDKETMERAIASVEKTLRSSPAENWLVLALLTIWPSRGTVRALHFRPRGCDYVIARRAITRKLGRIAHAPAEETVEQAVLRRFLDQQVAENAHRQAAAPANSTSSITSMFGGDQ
ncbi:nuclease-related domain-containing protein [Brevibacterium aurantiacum]|uniref:Nuclease-related domain-containing protein n=1 Tax=Brevibacterium aurantiacum TaxID=273384 RepID=A0A2H1HV73_BREAU|nr:nuclease-related domain-containing protein [Brevibacterium aurantiacum]SMX66782.1 Nuclease-related domain-containing protein [Brevibacterium aurantiacum]